MSEKWINNNLNNLPFKLYMNCFNINYENIEDYLIEKLMKELHINKNLANKYIIDNKQLIIDYIRKNQPKSFEDYIGMTKQKLVQLIQNETIFWTKNNAKTLIKDLGWPKNNDTMLYDINYQPNLFDYFFDIDNDNFSIADIVKKVYPNSKNLRYVNFEIPYIYKKFSWDKTFKKINNILKNYIINENKNVKNIQINHRQKINRIEDNEIKEQNIDFDTQIPFLRDAPIVVIHDFKNNKDYVLIGNYGQHHNNLLSQYPELKKNCKDKNGKEVFTCAYLHGLIAFVSELEYNGYNSLQEVADIIKKNEPNILKVFLSPSVRNRGGKIVQLAGLMKRI